MVYQKFQKDKNILSIPDAAKYLPCSYRILYKYIRSKEIKAVNYHTGPVHISLGMHIDEVNRVAEILKGPDNSTSIRDMVAKFHINETGLKKIAKKINAKPIYRSAPTKLSPKSDIYSIVESTKINQAIYWRNINIKFMDLTTNTTAIYDPKLDLSINRLGTFLRPENPVGNRIIGQWIQYGNIDEYSVDINGKLFFTMAQANHIKNRYRKLPDNLFGINKEVGDALGISPAMVTHFRKFYHLPCHKVLGYNEVYYTVSDADKLMDLYLNKEKRPYPYEHNKKLS